MHCTYNIHFIIYTAQCIIETMQYISIHYTAMHNDVGTNMAVGTLHILTTDIRSYYETWH